MSWYKLFYDHVKTQSKSFGGEGRRDDLCFTSCLVADGLTLYLQLRGQVCGCLCSWFSLGWPSDAAAPLMQWMYFSSREIFSLLWP